MKTVYDLTREELNELKLAYAVQLAENEGEEISWGELADSPSIPDDIIFNHYDGITFSEDDFFCNQEKMKEGLNMTMIEKIMQMLDAHKIKVWQEIGDDSAKCQIGEHWFYFTHIEDNECLENFATDELAEIILRCIMNPIENGLGDVEAQYYQAIICTE